MSPGGPRRERGIAALTALLVVAVATVLGVELMWAMTLDFRRTEALLLREQAAHFALGAEALAIEVLRLDAEADTDGIDSLDEPWAQEQAFPIDSGTIVGFIEDLQGRFNLNNLIDAQGRKDEVAIEHFRRLLRLVAAVAEDPDAADPDSIVDAVVDWIDPDQVPELGGAEDGVYTAQDPPYRAANFWFTTVSELQAVQGITPTLYAALAPLVAALPPGNGAPRPINVNTAPPLVLQALGADVSPTLVEDWLANRQTEPYPGVPEFLEPADGVVDPALQPYLAVGSSFFRVSVIVSIGTARLAMYSLLERSSQGTAIARLRSFDTD